MHFDNSDPMKPAPISSRLYTGEIRQFDKPIRSNSRAEPPSLGVTGFEIRERLAADRVDEDVTRLTVESFSGTGKAAAEHFELSGIHLQAFRRLRRLTDQDKRRAATDTGSVPQLVDPAVRSRAVARQRSGAGTHARSSADD